MSDQKGLDREAILAADDLKIESVDVPEWGGRVFVRTMTGHDRDEFDAECAKLRETDDHLKDFSARLVARCACDEKGARLFTVADVKALTGKSGLALDRVFETANDLNRITGDAVDDLVGNSESARSAGSGSD